MNGCYIALGKQGSGKTLMITKFCVDNYNDKPRPIFSNYELKKLPYTSITFETSTDPKKLSILDTLDSDPNYFNNSIMLLDEIHIYADSLDFKKNNSRRLQIFFSQLRKRNILLLATTQYIMNVDIRIRRQTKNVFEMKHIYKDLYKVITSEIDGYFTEEISSYNIVLKEYYSHYDTNEVILE
jgi:GTPase SAR1 family protein